MQQTRSKGQLTKQKEVSSPERKPIETKPMKDSTSKVTLVKSAKKPSEDDKRKGRKRNTDEKPLNSDRYEYYKICI